MHEFVLKGKDGLLKEVQRAVIKPYAYSIVFRVDVAAAEFRQIKGVQTILLSLLTADEMYISRVVLRTIKFMAHGQGMYDGFQTY